eukprot:s192_g19.t1
MVDLTEAFYRVLRPLAVGCPFSDEQIAAVAHKLGMPQDMRRHLREPNALEQANLPQHLKRVIRSIHTDTFFKMPHQSDCCHTTVGSRPGDSFADVVFSYLFSRVLKHFQQKVDDLDLQEWVPAAVQFDPLQSQHAPHAMQRYLGPVWMDDLCTCITAETPHGLLHKAGTIASLLLETLEEYGMTPNLQKGKTELLLSLRGQGVRRCRQQVFGPHSDGTLPVICETGIKHLTVVGQYVHLGGLLHHGGDHRQDMRRRVAQANAAFNQHRRDIFQNAALPLVKRIELFQTLILSKLTYGSDSWVLRDCKSREYLHAAVMRLYKRVLKFPAMEHVPDDEVLNLLRLPTPTELFRQSRLRYLGMLHRCQDATAWGLLNQDREWCSLIQDDLRWMWKQLEHSSGLKDPDQHFESWRYLWLYHGRFWKGLIRRAAQHAILQRCNAHVVRGAHQHILHRLEVQGHIQVPPFVFADVGPQSQSAHFGCMSCGIRFKSKGGEGAHMFKRHGVLSSLRYLFDQTRCEVCMKEYFTYGKLHSHLRHSHACRRTLQLRMTTCGPVAGHGSQVNCDMEQQHNGLLSTCEADAQAFGHTKVTIEELLTSLAHPTAWPFLCATEEVTKKAVEVSLDEWEWLCDYSTPTPPSQWNCRPQGFGTHRYVLHAFSGRRRKSDFQMFLDAITKQFEGIYVYTLSVDIILDSRWGNVADKEVQKFWLHASQQRWVIGYLAGPPCETWSKAREVTLAPAQGHHSAFGPRVIRTILHPWGEHSLSLRELRQIIIGNQLMLFSIDAMAELYLVQGCGAVEHPALPDNSTSVSVWRTPLMNLLRSLEGSPQSFVIAAQPCTYRSLAMSSVQTLLVGRSPPWRFWWHTLKAASSRSLCRGQPDQLDDLNATAIAFHYAMDFVRIFLPQVSYIFQQQAVFFVLCEKLDALSAGNWAQGVPIPQFAEEAIESE